jgi:hypothetical protein
MVCLVEDVCGPLVRYLHVALYQYLRLGAAERLCEAWSWAVCGLEQMRVGG